MLPSLLLCSNDYLFDAYPSSVLIRRVFALWSALYLLVDDDRSIGGVVAHARVTDMDYYPSVSAGRAHVGIEASLELQWAREA